MSQDIFDSKGQRIYPDSWPQTIIYNADSTVNYVEVINGNGTWRQTYSYTAGLLTGISAWVKQ